MMCQRNKSLYAVTVLLLLCLSCVLWIFAKEYKEPVEIVEWETQYNQACTAENDRELPKSSLYNYLFQGKGYDSIDDFGDNEVELPYIDERLYELLKTAYGEIDFKGEFKCGNTDVYDTYKKAFKKMLYNEIPFLDKRTGDVIYWKDLDGIEYYNEYDLADDAYEYYFFDMDEDEAPELVMRIRMLYLLYFRYDPETEQCILWYSQTSNWASCFGSRKVSLFWDAIKGFFWQLSKDGEVECEVVFLTISYSVDNMFHLCAFPVYADKQKEVVLTDELKNQGLYRAADNKWLFRVTEQQYEELVKEYIEAWEEASKEIKEVRYTYEELFGE